MSICWKCLREIPFGTECDPPCMGRPDLTDEEVSDNIRLYDAHHVAIDPSKVQSFEDLKEVMLTVFAELDVEIGTPAFHRLRRFLKNETLDGKPLTAEDK